MGFSAFLTSLVTAAAGFQAVLAASTPSSVAPSVASSVAPRKDDGPKLYWTGPVWQNESKPDMTFQVKDVSELWETVLGTNPGWTLPAPDPDATLRDYGPRFCGTYGAVATGNQNTIDELLTKLLGLGGSWTLDAGKCHRLACDKDAGVYWCNNNAWNIRTSAANLYLRASHIHDGCCHTADGSLYYNDPMGGVEFFPPNHLEAANSNVAIGYGHCSDPVDIVPIRYTFPGKLGAGSCPV